MTPIQVVLFDLGSTLIFAKDPWPPFYKRADKALSVVLRKAGIAIDSDHFSDEYASFLEAYYSQPYQDNAERTSYTALQELLSKKGFPNVPDPVLRAALNAEYAITQTNWFIEADALSTLGTLKQLGYRLGMISNTSDDKNVQQLVDRWGLRPYFEMIVTSAAVGIRKPDRRIFQVALDHFGIPPGRTAMVGDLLAIDIEGANRLGIYSIWITRRVEGPYPAVQPQTTVNSLGEIPGLLEQLRA